MSEDEPGVTCPNCATECQLADGLWTCQHCTWAGEDPQAAKIPPSMKAMQDASEWDDAVGKVKRGLFRIATGEEPHGDEYSHAAWIYSVVTEHFPAACATVLAKDLREGQRHREKAYMQIADEIAGNN